MRVIITKDYDEMSKEAARIIAKQIKEKPDSVIGFATGGTPLGTYKELIRMHKEGGLDFSKITTFNLDEYYGLGPDHPQSYHYYMFENLFNPSTRRRYTYPTDSLRTWRPSAKSTRRR